MTRIANTADLSSLRVSSTTLVATAWNDFREAREIRRRSPLNPEADELERRGVQKLLEAAAVQR